MSTKCTQCGADCWSGRDEYKLCTKCQIGDQSPSIWLFQKLKSEIENLDQVSGWRKDSKTRGACKSLKYNVITGECFGTNRPYEDDAKDYVSVMASVDCKNDEKFSETTVSIRKWIWDGQRSIGGKKSYPISSFENLVEEGAPLFVVAVCQTIDFLKEDMYHCAGCEEDKKNPPAGSYFAGTYCGPCWDKYKQRNSRTCLKCRRPMYECYC